MTWIDLELALISLAAMLSPTTLTFSILALALGNRPLRTGFWFYVGALGTTLVIGIVAAFVIGDIAASGKSTPRPSVAVIDIVFAVAILVFVYLTSRRPPNPAKTEAMVERMGKLATAPIAAIVGAGATLANPGGFIPLALKDISETDPSSIGYIVEWVFFALVSLLPLGVALIMLLVAREWTYERLGRLRFWLQRHLRAFAFVILILLAASLLRNGIAGLTS